ncbi:MAG: hypothetical protein ABUL48_02880, partial [Pseudorhodoplanes sp.]
IRAMGVLLLTCPTTGRDYSTGIQIDAASFHAIDPSVMTISVCPHCQKGHEWRRADARLVDEIPPGMWVENRKPGEGG